MARKRNTETKGDPENRFPAERIRQFLFELRNALALTEGGPQKLEDLEQLTGRSWATIGSWYQGGPMPQLEFVLSLLERLPQSVRHQLLDRTCRIHPSIVHPSIGHDPLAVLRLEEIIRQPNGLTIVRGQKNLQAFVLAAIINSIPHVRRGKVSVCGIETQMVPWTTPRGVMNTQSRKDPNHWTRTITRIKSASAGSVVLLAGDWAGLNGLGAELGRLASRCNVIASEPAATLLNSVRPRPDNIQRLTVARVNAQPEWLEITFQSDRP